MLDFDSIQTFLAVAEAQSFTRAAEELFCTQAAISMRVKRLEEHLECPLFRRLPRQVVLTKEGEVFLPYARQLDNTWKSSKDALLRTRIMEQGELHIACSSTPGTYIVPSLLYLFRQKHPYISVVNHVQYTRHVLEAVRQEQCVLGIVSQPLMDSSEFVCEPLMDDPLVLAVNHGHPWAGRGAVELKQLANETFLISNPHTSLIRYLQQTGGFAFKPEGLYVAGNIEAIKRCIYEGQGVSLMSRYALEQELRLGLLREVPVAGCPPLTRKIYVVRRADQELKLSTKIFLKFIREEAQQGLCAE